MPLLSILALPSVAVKSIQKPNTHSRNGGMTCRPRPEIRNPNPNPNSDPDPSPNLKVEDVITPESRVCLVDFQQSTQLNKAIRLGPTPIRSLGPGLGTGPDPGSPWKAIKPSQVVGVIDHHALQNATIVTDLPIYIDIRHPNPDPDPDPDLIFSLHGHKALIPCA